MSINIKLPLEYSAGIATRIYLKRLIAFLAIALVNFILVAFILPIETHPVFSLIINFSLVIGTVIAFLLHLSTQKTSPTSEVLEQSRLFAIGESARYTEAILQTIVQGLDERMPTVAEHVADGNRLSSDLAEMPVEALDLSVHVFKSLKRSGINSVGDVLELLNKGELLGISAHNFGEKNIKELRQKMDEKGFLKESVKTANEE